MQQQQQATDLLVIYFFFFRHGLISYLTSLQHTQKMKVQKAKNVEQQNGTIKENKDEEYNQKME